MTVSSKATTPCGVPQGSVLGPLLFLIYINDIPNSSSKLSFCLFADDTNMLFADNNLRSLEATVNNELKNVCDWLTANKLTLNTKKSYFVIFRPRQKKLEYEVNLTVIGNNTDTLTSLECKEYVKYLGVLIDSHLSWKFHIDYVAFKLSKIDERRITRIETVKKRQGHSHTSRRQRTCYCCYGQEGLYGQNGLTS